MSPAADTWIRFDAGLIVNLQYIANRRGRMLRLQQKHLVKHVDHAVGLIHVGDGYADDIALNIRDQNLIALGPGDEETAGDILGLSPNNSDHPDDWSHT